ncbi:ATP-binding protein [Streptomyces sp. NPDC048340]|uniref:ATP-binding protein n=1 Tax=Streptomyces sp. NPDC048340 TaxID=3365537 RepID=UPI003711DB8D
MTRTAFREPQQAGEHRLVAQWRERLAERGIAFDGPQMPDRLDLQPALDAAQSRIPFDYQDAKADHPVVAAWVAKVAETAVADNRGGRGRRAISHGPSLLLWGPTGTGKTRQAYGAIRALTAAGCGVAWEAVFTANLYAEMRPRPGVDPEWMLRRYMRAPVLLLDDLGLPRHTAWNEELTGRLLNYRAERHLPTLVTTNLPPVRTPGMAAQQEVLRDKIGDRVLSRLSGMCVQVELDGPDRRYLRA